MHYRVLAILEEPSIDKLAELMEPYGDGREWDFYQIGGRYTGFLDGYAPEKDPRNLEPCQYHQSPDCPHCKGTGSTVTWPTRWAPHIGDQIPVSQLTDVQVKGVYVIVCSAGWFARERYTPWEDGKAAFPKQPMPPLGWIQEAYAKGLAIVVDIHN